MAQAADTDGPTNTAEHTLVRVRNNQRRHRQRRRDYIVSLERRLATSERQVIDLQAENAMLRAQRISRSPVPGIVEVGTTFSGIGPLPSLHPSSPDNKTTPDTLRFNNVNPGVDLTWDDLSLMRAFNVGSDQHSRTTSEIQQINQHNETVIASTPEQRSSTAIDRHKESGGESTNGCCRHIQENATGTTTMLCSHAYLLVFQHNVRSMSEDAIENWLKPGFYRPTFAEKGCRVDHQLVFSLLDYITERPD